jgi:hypothetical protein
MLVRRIVYSAIAFGAAGWALWRYWPGSKADTYASGQVALAHSSVRRPRDGRSERLRAIWINGRALHGREERRGGGRSSLGSTMTIRPPHDWARMISRAHTGVLNNPHTRVLDDLARVAGPTPVAKHLRRKRTGSLELDDAPVLIQDGRSFYWIR